VTSRGVGGNEKESGKPSQTSKQSTEVVEGTQAALRPSQQEGWVFFGPLEKALQTMWKLSMNEILLLFAQLSKLSLYETRCTTQPWYI